ncbi:glycosyltransferase family 2 protein [Winogradskyella tangerina]|uniref:glycosyltransferase family 2 protein n=1 Tax=Winogradskyella tangerina TaxID=2023240 RepID=UPI000DBE66D2|nr:glycosyltransferase family 2 protein [Winogradskyella tangerina]
MKKSDISVVIPIYNEQDSLLELYERLTKSLSNFTDNYDIIFVNDGSSDNSLEIMLGLSEKDKHVYYINFSRNFGHQIALSAGLEYCHSETTVLMDGDLQDPPELIEKLYSKYKEGFDVVYAKRQKREGETWVKKFTAKVFYRLFKRMIPFEIPLDTGDFRLISQKVVKSLNKMTERSKFLRGQIAWLGFNHAEVLFDREPRKHGEIKYSYSKLTKLALDGITGFSDKPLIMVSRLGFIISIFSFLVIIYAIFSHFVLKHSITGWTSLIISSAFIGGIQLLSIGVIGEYINRINNNTRERPLFIVKDTNIKSDED